VAAPAARGAVARSVGAESSHGGEGYEALQADLRPARWAILGFMVKGLVISAVAAILLILLAPVAQANHSCSASLAVKASNATPCGLAFKVSEKVSSAAQHTGEFPNTARVRHRNRTYRFSRQACFVASDATYGRARYVAHGGLSVTQGWRLPHDDGLFDDPSALCG
jgi:hypothetical protein